MCLSTCTNAWLCVLGECADALFVATEEVDQILSQLRKEQRGREKAKEIKPPTETELRKFKLEEVFHVCLLIE